jgi:L-histidine N-alpha-methyltransferase
MPGPPNVEIEVHLSESDDLRSMGREVREGLTSTPKRLPSKYFYDERGSALFEKITELPEYYLTRAEQALLEASAGAVARLTGLEELVELGSGSAKKTRVLIDAGLAEGSLRRFLPVEVSVETAERTARAMAESYPGLEVHAVVGDFEQDLHKLPGAGERLVIFLGSTIGNFPGEQASRLLKKIAGLVGPDGWFLLGTDLVKDRTILEAAYNDAQGVTAEFNANILDVVNSRLGGDFDSRRFEHVAFYNSDQERIESYLRSRERHTVRLEGIDLDVSLDEDEMIHTEVSCKYRRSSVESILARAGMTMHHWFTDVGETFALSLSRNTR